MSWLHEDDPALHVSSQNTQRHKDSTDNTSIHTDDGACTAAILDGYCSAPSGSLNELGSTGKMRGGRAHL